MNAKETPLPTEIREALQRAADSICSRGHEEADHYLNGQYQEYILKELGPFLRSPSGFEGGWIPCSERMPPQDGTWVVLWSARWKLPEVAQWISEGEHGPGWCTTHGTEIFNPPFWSDLPPPPITSEGQEEK